MICSDYETWLIDRIAIRQAAARLAPRERRVLTRYYGHNETLWEVGQHEGVSKERVRQICLTAECKLRGVFAAEPLRPTARRTPPLGFDTKAFLRHMQGLIVLREAQKRAAFERERDELDRLLAEEEPKPSLPPPPLPKVIVKPAPKPHYSYLVPWKPEPQHYAFPSFEPWFDLSNALTPEYLRQIALYALDYFVKARGPTEYGSPHIGKMFTLIDVERTADGVSTAMQHMRKDIPPYARLSAWRRPIPDGLLGVTVASAFVAMRIMAAEDERKVSFEITWDP